jgi:stress-induced morphogen
MLSFLRRATTAAAASTAPFAAAPARWTTHRPFSSALPLSKEDAIEKKLRNVMAATHVQVDDISGGCGSMYKIFVVSPEFEGLALVKQHRLVQKAIAGEIADMHGLTLKTQTAKQFKKTKDTR